ncbi:unnamed protein product [Heligmosomoides polygyrus]|uniref:DNA primase n=1 Tax=Heligmosomoides polygyrus TaxID=6339 RepID=A0A183GMI2_HELPZ|nr:unnamed protein product [Heligmosomoides polygyrus]
MLDKRFHYLNMPIARVLEEGGLLREAIRRMHPEVGICNAKKTRPKRYGTDIDEVMFEDPSAKRTSLKRLAILSARGFGRK